MIKTKIVRTGNSAAVILPAAVLEAKGLKIGDDLEIEELVSDLVLRVSGGRRSVARATDRTILEHGAVLKKLASR
jgi:antitoxin component of MazEF toxin-antitoxin module